MNEKQPQPVRAWLVEKIPGRIPDEAVFLDEEKARAFAVKFGGLVVPLRK